MKYIDLFAGVGGFRYGIEKTREQVSGTQERQKKVRNTGNELFRAVGNNGHSRQSPEEYTCVYSNEWDKYANSVYRKHYGECDDRDIREVKATDIPGHDLLCGGFPCQAFSVAGKRRGFAETRGTLFFEIARILKAKQTKRFILENVKGLLSHDGGATFKTIITTLDALGYDCQWQVLNSKNFGVPQNRERVFIVGNLRGTPRPQVFPITGEDREDVQQGSEKQEGRSWVSTLDSRYGGRWSSETYVRTDKQDTQQKGDKPDSSNIIRRTSYTDGMRIRRLTPIECERLQGFPDNWTKYGADGELISDTQRYKMMGNAVTTGVITAIAQKLLYEQKT